jgi:hypothetical protein
MHTSFSLLSYHLRPDIGCHQMHTSMQMGKVDSRRVVVDVERGRTVPNWRPRRLGGGLGLGRFSGDGADLKHPSRYIHYLLLIT